MTRKRFIKLLMADGRSIREARWQAQAIQDRKNTYEIGYIAHKVILCLMDRERMEVCNENH